MSERDHIRDFLFEHMQVVDILGDEDETAFIIQFNCGWALAIAIDGSNSNIQWHKMPEKEDLN